jgi:hypothetical protein
MFYWRVGWRGSSLELRAGLGEECLILRAGWVSREWAECRRRLGGEDKCAVEGWMVGTFLVFCCGLQLRARWRGMFIKGWVGGRDGFVVERWMVGKD